MDLWIGAEMENDIAEEFRLARNELEDELAKYLKPKEYQIDLDSLDCIAIIRNDSVFEEIHRYSPTKRDMDFRLVIDYTKFKASTHEQRKLLVLHMLMRATDILSSKSTVSASEAMKLKEDLRHFDELDSSSTT